MSVPKFKTFLWSATKTGKVGFYNKYLDDSQDGNILEADFTRANTTEDGTKSGRVVINESGDLVNIGVNEPGWSYPIGGSASGSPYLNFLPSSKNIVTNSLPLAVNYQQNTGSVASNSTDNYVLIDSTAGISAYSRMVLNAPPIVTNDTVSFMGLYKPSNLGDGKIYFGLSVNGLNSSGVNGGDIAVACFNPNTLEFEFVNNANGRTTNGIGKYLGQSSDGAYWLVMQVQFIALTITGIGHLHGFSGSGGSSAHFVKNLDVQVRAITSAIEHIPTSGLALTRRVENGFNFPNSYGYNFAIELQFESKFLSGNTSYWIIGFNDSVGLVGYIRVTNVNGINFNIYNQRDNVTLSNGTLKYDVQEGYNKLVWVQSSTTISLWQNGDLIGTYTKPPSWGGIVTIGPGPRSTVFGGTIEQITNIKRLNIAYYALTALEAEVGSSWPTLAEMQQDLGYDIQ